MKTVVTPGALDTKGADYEFLARNIRSHGVNALTVDFGVLGDPLFLPDVSSVEVARAAGVDLNSLRQGLFTPGQRRTLVTTDAAGGEEANSEPPRSATKVPRPISPRVHPSSASDLKAAVTVVKLTPKSDASRRTVGRRSPGFSWPVRMAWQTLFAICSYRGAPSTFRLAVFRRVDIVLVLSLCMHLQRTANSYIRSCLEKYEILC